MPDPANLITPFEAAALVRRSAKTVRRAYLSGALPSYRAPGGRKVLLDRTEVLGFFLAERATTPSSAPVPASPARNKPLPPKRLETMSLSSGRRAPLAAPPVVDISLAALRARREQRAASVAVPVHR